MDRAGLLLSILAVLALHAHAAAVRGSQAVTPVEQVIQLLGKLSAKIEAEGKAEAAQYDKYSCFCKEQADNKLYAIETSQKKNAAYEAMINELSADIAQLTSEITELGNTIADLESQIKTAGETRAEDHKAYAAEAADMSGAIDALERAIAALKESKAQMGGKTELEAMVQVRAVAARVLSAAALYGAALSDGQLSTLSSLSKTAQPGEIYQYSYHSNEILSTLEDLRKTFKENKVDLDNSEFQANAAFETLTLGLTNEKTFRSKDKDEKERLSEQKTETLHATQKDLASETAAMNADQAFLDVLTQDCQTKAGLFDQRSTTRSSEITSITEALEALKSGVQPNFDANKKLVGLQQKQVVVSMPPTSASKAAQATGNQRPVSFLQLRGGMSGAEVVRQKVMRVLGDAASRLRSPVLSAAALKVQLSQDHFVKVRQLIKDLVARLEQQKSDEAETKSFCDTHMTAAVARRDAKQGEVEDFEAKMAQKTAEEAKLNQEVAELSQAIANNLKALNEATELRNTEKADNEKVIADASEGKASVELALSTLKAFYEGPALIQKRLTYVPPNSDREGHTVSDLAPEVFNTEYHGSSSESKGVLGLLEVIQSDFQRTITTVTEQEASAQTAFDAFKSANEADTTAKQDEVTTKQASIASIKDELVTLESGRKDSASQHELALAELETLSASCVKGEETYEERVERRKKEIEALKEAKAILEEWQG